MEVGVKLTRVPLRAEQKPLSKIANPTRLGSMLSLVFVSTTSFVGCGSRSALLEDRGPADERLQEGTGGSADPCDPTLDLNSGPGEWLNEMRLPPTSGDNFAVSSPSIVTTVSGVSLSYLLSPPLFEDPENPYSPGLVFSHSATPIGLPDPSFSFELVDPNAVSAGDLATDGNSFFLCYRSQQGLELATKDSDRWSSELVVAYPAEGDLGGSSRCVVDGRGDLHVVHHDAGFLLHSIKSRNTWMLRSVASLNSDTPIQSLSLDVGRGGAVHAVWIETAADETHLRHAWYDGEWTIEELATPQGVDDVALGVTTEGEARLVILDRSAATPLVFGKRVDGAWLFEVVDSALDFDGFGYVSLDLGPDGSAHVIVGSRFPTYVSNQTGAWVSQFINLSADDRVNLAIDASGAAHAVSRYFHYPNNIAPHYKTNRAVSLDGIDQNCDGVDGLDDDGDGQASRWTGGDDCDDSDAVVQECLTD